MSKLEIDRLEIIQKIIDRRLTQSQASEILHISTRQIQRLIRAYHLHGVVGLISKKRGMSSNRAIPETLKEYAIQLIRTHYSDFGPTLATEKLFEIHGLKLAVETVRGLMLKADIWIPRSKRCRRSYQPRYRRAAFGELIQIG